MIVTKTIFGKVVDVWETDQYHRTEMNAMKDSKKWGTGWRKHLPLNVWVEDPPKPFEDNHDLNSQ